MRTSQLNSGRQWSIDLGLTFLAMAICISVEAQEERSAPREQRTVLEEIIVSAQKVEENLQDVPLSLSSFSAEALERSHLVRIDDLRTRVPNFDYHEFNIGLPRIFIRGIGSQSRSGASDPAVGVFSDEVYVGRTAGATGDFLDIERVEILRGPQGTLFGRNVVGGALVLHSMLPQDEFDWSAEVEAGNHGRFDVRGMLNVPISETASFRVAALSRNYDGHSFNTLSGNNLDDQNREALRASLLFQPNDDLDIALRVEYGKDDALGQWWDLAVEGPFSQGKGNPDPREGDNPLDGKNDREDVAFTGTVNWMLGDGTLTSITGYRNNEYYSIENTTSLVVLPLNDPNRFSEHHTLFIQSQDQDSDQFSQEVRYASPVDQRFRWIAGLFYLHEEVDVIRGIDYRFLSFNSEGHAGWDGSSELDSFAAFAQFQYDLTEKWTAILGGRWTRDEKSVTSVTSGKHFSRFRDFGVVVPGWSAAGEDDWSEFTPSASLNYHWNDGVMLYGSIAKGFKSGGFNDGGGPERADVVTPFSPEFVWNYELGIKSEFWDRRARINASLYYMDYTDLQVGQIVQTDPTLPPYGITGNAGEADVSGVELEANFLLAPGLLVFGSYSYNDNELNDIIINNVDQSGNHLAFAPKNKFNIGAIYEFLLGDYGTLSLRAEYSAQDEFFTEISNSEVIRVASRDLVDAGIDWVAPQGNWSVTLWGKNLTDELYWTAASEVPVRDGYVKYGAPRTYGVTVAYRH